MLGRAHSRGVTNVEGRGDCPVVLPPLVIAIPLPLNLFMGYNSELSCLRRR
jgi:hypothetical protein